MDPIVKYILEQTSGVVIALVLIFKVQSKLDVLVAAVNEMTTTLSKNFEKSSEK